MRLVRQALLTVGAVVLLALSMALGMLRSTLHERPAASAPGVPMEVRVPDGLGFATVAGLLEERGLIVSGQRVTLLARVLRADRGVPAGTFAIPQGATAGQVLRVLLRGEVFLRRFRVLEGWRLGRIADEVEQQFDVPKEEFMIAAADSMRRASAGCTAETLEGYLFPDTYRLPDGMSAGEIVDALVARLDEVTAALPPPSDGALPDLSRHEVLTLASIVEAETRMADERPHVAAVYLNRLRQGWKLEADPTVRYGIGRFRGRLYYKHLKIESPYNTYRNHGLPPGPIGAPGRASIDAVLHPLTPCEDMFFVADGSGGHTFSVTREEHERAANRARTSRRS
jgi:UPF0755 protein